MGWEEAGVAWSDRAVDWAYLMEPLFTPVYDALTKSLDLKSTDALLDVRTDSIRRGDRKLEHAQRIAQSGRDGCSWMRLGARGAPRERRLWRGRRSGARQLGRQ